MPLEPAGESSLSGRLLSASIALGCPLLPPEQEALLAYLALLQRWNKVYNLTALRQADEMLSHHLVDCLAVLPPLRAWWAGPGSLSSRASGQQDTPARLLDVGSGGGLPGVVLAVMQPGWQVHCVDTVAKKASFIRQVAAELRLPNLQGLHARVEALTAEPEGASPGYQVITSRAFASLADFTALTAHLLAPGGVWVAMKGRLPAEEQASLPASVEVFHVEQLRVPGLDAQRCLVWMRPRPG